MRRPTRGETGEALILALLVLLMTSAAAALLAGDLMLRMREAQQEARSAHLGELVDAALAEALAELHRSATFGGRAPHAFGEGSIASRVQRVYGSPDRYEILAWARLGVVTRSVAAEARLFDGQPVLLSWQRSTMEDPP